MAKAKKANFRQAEYTILLEGKNLDSNGMFGRGVAANTLAGARAVARKAKKYYYPQRKWAELDCVITKNKNDSGQRQTYYMV